MIDEVCRMVTMKNDETTDEYRLVVVETRAVARYKENLMAMQGLRWEAAWVGSCQQLKSH